MLRRIVIGTLAIDSGAVVVVDPSVLLAELRSTGADRAAMDRVNRVLSSFSSLGRLGEVRPGSAVGGIEFEVDSDGTYCVHADYDDDNGRLRRVIVELPIEPE